MAAVGQGLIVAGVLVMVAFYGAMALLFSVGNVVIPVLMLAGVFSAEVRDWFAEVARRRAPQWEAHEPR